MSNPHHGAVEFEAQGKRYSLRFSIDAICHLEAATGRTFPAIAVDMANPARVSVTLMRHLLHAGLLEHHPGIDLKTAGDLIVGAGGFDGVMQKVDTAIGLAFPAAAEASGTPRPPRPPANRAARRRAGIG